MGCPRIVLDAAINIPHAEVHHSIRRGLQNDKQTPEFLTICYSKEQRTTLKNVRACCIGNICQRTALTARILANM
jgi:hypothetical protein